MALVLLARCVTTFYTEVWTTISVTEEDTWIEQLMLFKPKTVSSMKCICMNDVYHTCETSDFETPSETPCLQLM